MVSVAEPVEGLTAGLKDDNYVQMLEKPQLHIGPPQSYAEAVYRFPDPGGAESLYELWNLLRWPHLLDGRPLRDRMIGVSPVSIREIEQWSFRRNMESVRKVGWDYFLPHRRVKPFEAVFEADELYRELSVWTFRPQNLEDEFIMVCVEASPGFISEPPDYFLGFLKREEYRLLTTYSYP